MENKMNVQGTENERAMQDRVLERYENLHKKLDQGMTSENIIQEELSAAFPDLGQDEIRNIAAKLKETGISFVNKMEEITELTDVVSLWIEKLDNMSDEEKLSSIHAYRLMDELVTEENIRLAAEGNFSLDEEEIQNRLDEMDSGAPVWEQVEEFLAWVNTWGCMGMQRSFWEKEKEMLQNLQGIHVTEEILKQFYSRVNSMEERTLYSCAYMVEAADPGMDPENIAPLAALMANASLESEKVYLENMEDLIDEEEAMTRLEKIWNCVEAVLVELLPVVAGSVVMAAIVTPFLYIPGLPQWAICAIYLVAAPSMLITMAAVDEPVRRLMGKIGEKIKKWSRSRKAAKAEETPVYESVFTEEELRLAELTD